MSILRPRLERALVSPTEVIKSAIRFPINSNSLREIVKRKDNLRKVCIVIDDATRPVPSRLILEPLIQELKQSGVENSQITVLIATSLHRKSSQKEIERMIGRNLIRKVNVVNHSSTNKDDLKFLGTSKSKIPIFINKNYCESDLKVLTGYVEPHFFFGFSGGSKSIVPGIAGAETIQLNHSAKNVASPYARFGSYDKNPMVSISNEIASTVGADFTVNVCINEKHQLTQVAAGDLNAVHEVLVRYQLKYIFSKIPHLYDIVICGNGGFPLDLNLYQAVKSMAIGEMAVKEGGTIISVNECSDGVGIGQNEFKKLIFSGLTPTKLYAKIISSDIVVPDQWEIQI
ncbi:MAG: nickel-dependent lactate racemase [Promethearchaeota archaeon]|nr:MAG: nickel-dependent lactate racemase [Candidatus Lokiarchaeota archaeon]